MHKVFGDAYCCFMYGGMVTQGVIDNERHGAVLSAHEKTEHANGRGALRHRDGEEVASGLEDVNEFALSLGIVLYNV